MSHLFNNLGHRLATTAFTALPYIVAIVFALYLVANMPYRVSGTLISGLPMPYWLGTAAAGIIIVLVIFALYPENTQPESTHDHD